MTAPLQTGDIVVYNGGDAELKQYYFVVEDQSHFADLVSSTTVVRRITDNSGWIHELPTAQLAIIGHVERAQLRLLHGRFVGDDTFALLRPWMGWRE